MFLSAERHSRRVRALKLTLPVAGVLLAAGFVAYSWLLKPTAVEITAEGSEISEGKLVMSAPKLQGYTRDDRPYALSAERAIQDVSLESVVRLEGIAAQLPYDATNSATITAAHGTFDRTSNTLDVDSAIDIRTSNGALARLQSALLDIPGGRMSTGDPVEITYEGASINADSMAVEENGAKVIFEKRVRVYIQPRTEEMESQ
jgi:lipopolysaccharide export system protein LptC